MYVNAASSTAQIYDTPKPNASGDLGSDTTQTFLTLLMTQLKTQDPLSPMDPKEMVSQLVQFNTLGQIMQIRELIQQQQTVTSDTNGNIAQPSAGGR